MALVANWSANNPLGPEFEFLYSGREELPNQEDLSDTHTPEKMDHLVCLLGGKSFFKGVLFRKPKVVTNQKHILKCGDVLQGPQRLHQKLGYIEDSIIRYKYI